MTDETKKPDAGAAKPGTGEAAAQASAAPGGPQAASAAGEGSDVGQLTAEVTKLEGQIKDLTDRLLRAHADMDNLRKRSEREREETARYAISKFAVDIVGMTDNFERTIAAVPPDAAAADPALQALLEGVQMTEAEFLKVLERHGVRRIDPLGELFNPHAHQAMMESQNPGVPAGTILQVFQPGYQIADRIIRPAMVVVARGGPKPKAGNGGEPAANGNEA